MDIGCHMSHLDDACLLNVFRHLLPLPDLFNVARTCKRFQTLTHDKRMWLVVNPNGARKDARKEATTGKFFKSLGAAIIASRPGDTIWLAPGVSHLVSDLTVPWPLHLVGGGVRPEDTSLLCPAGADAALDFRATGKLANLQVVAERGACVVHRRGQLRVERCVLECRALGLHHLCAPLITLASVCHPPKVLLGSACMTGIGLGSLSVAETQLLGGSKAVRCNGSGALQNVRVMYYSRSALFWFLVDSRSPGHFPAPPAPAAGPPPTKPLGPSHVEDPSHSKLPHRHSDPFTATPPPSTPHPLPIHSTPATSHPTSVASQPQHPQHAPPSLSSNAAPPMTPALFSHGPRPHSPAGTCGRQQPSGGYAAGAPPLPSGGYAAGAPALSTGHATASSALACFLAGLAPPESHLGAGLRGNSSAGDGGWHSGDGAVMGGAAGGGCLSFGSGLLSSSSIVDQMVVVQPGRRGEPAAGDSAVGEQGAGRGEGHYMADLDDLSDGDSGSPLGGGEHVAGGTSNGGAGGGGSGLLLCTAARRVVRIEEATVFRPSGRRREGQGGHVQPGGARQGKRARE